MRANGRNGKENDNPQIEAYSGDVVARTYLPKKSGDSAERRLLV